MSHRIDVARLTCLAAICAALFACKPPEPPPGTGGPVDAVQGFVAAVHRGDAAGAWAMLSKRTQQQADALAAEARGKSGTAVPESGRQMLFSSALPGKKPTAKEISKDAGVAEVEVTGGGTTRRYRAVKEGDAWKLELDLAVR